MSILTNTTSRWVDNNDNYSLKNAMAQPRYFSLVLLNNVSTNVVTINLTMVCFKNCIKDHELLKSYAPLKV